MLSGTMFYIAFKQRNSLTLSKDEFNKLSAGRKSVVNNQRLTNDVSMYLMSLIFFVCLAFHFLIKINAQRIEITDEMWKLSVKKAGIPKPARDKKND